MSIISADSRNPLRMETHCDICRTMREICPRAFLHVERFRLVAPEQGSVRSYVFWGGLLCGLSVRLPDCRTRQFLKTPCTRFKAQLSILRRKRSCKSGWIQPPDYGFSVSDDGIGYSRTHHLIPSSFGVANSCCYLPCSKQLDVYDFTIHNRTSELRLNVATCGACTSYVWGRASSASNDVTHETAEDGGHAKAQPSA